MSRETSQIQREIKQTKPFRSLAQEAAISLLRTADLLRRRIEGVMTSNDVTPQQYNVLRILRGAGTAGLPTLEIGERMIEQAPGVTRLLDRLEIKRLVRRERCLHDRRQVLCYITEAGLELLAALDDPVDQADEGAMSGLSKAEIKTLIGLLDKLRAIHRE
ncbi:MAG: MarR family transcriptional regulator [Acidobacteria bacterium]|nr:MarR family transcriptional regulator [Acidobacteriota bacterium]